MNAQGVDLDELLRRIDFLRREVELLKASRADAQGRGMVLPRAIIAPALSEVTRGLLYRTEGAAGVADSVFVVVKDAADAYVAFQVLP